MCTLLAAGAACSSGTDVVVVPPVTSTITLSLGSAAGSVTAGSTGTFTVSAVRTGTFTGPIDLSVEGLPSGVTAAVSPAQLTGTTTSATVTLTAAASAAASASTLTVRGKGTGVTDVTSSYALTVAAAPAAGGFTLAMSPATLSVASGANGASTVTITRSGSFTGAVNLAVSGAPGGVTATLSSASVAGATATLTVAVAAGTPASTGTITVTGSATGVANATSTVGLTTTVTAPPSGGAIAYRFCEGPFPTWFAIQDGTSGAWTRVTGTNNTYNFDLTNNLGGVAYAIPNGTSVTTSVWYGTKAEITARGVNSCPTATSKTLTGTTAGVTGTDQAFINFGNRNTVVIPVATTAFTLNGVADGAHDLVAGRSILSLNGLNVSATLAKIIIRRALNPANNSAFPVLDFGAAEAFTPASATMTLTNLGADVSVMTIGYATANGSVGVLYGDIGAGGASRTVSGVPAAQQIAGDAHLINATALPANYLTDPIAAVTSRGAGVYIGALSAQTLAFGSALATPTVTVAASAPYVRLKSVLARQAEYNQYFYANFQQQGAAPRSVIIEATAAWVGAGAFDVTVPDFTAAGGYDNAWGLKSGVSTMWILNATGWSTASPTPTVGVSFKNAQKAGQLTP
ncbi:MAG: hypothetical protein ABI664_04895 [bacterium]